MTPNDARQMYDLVFQGVLGGGAKVEAYNASSKKLMQKLHFSQGDKINIRILGPDGSTLSMESVQIEFKKVSGSTVSPLGNGTEACFTYYAGQQYTETVHANGRWDFGAVLTSKDGKHTYTLPDPEFQVGDG